jgi:hypothetical protein
MLATKFIRGVDPKESLGLGLDYIFDNPIECYKSIPGGYYKIISNDVSAVIVKIPPNRSIETYSLWYNPDKSKPIEEIEKLWMEKKREIRTWNKTNHYLTREEIQEGLDKLEAEFEIIDKVWDDMEQE